MKPDFKNINISTDAFGAQHKPVAAGEEWLTPELIPVKPIYTAATPCSTSSTPPSVRN